MALTLSAKAKLLTARRNIEPNLILEIDGVETIYSTIQVYKLARYGEDDIVYGQSGLVYGGGIPLENSKPLISLDGSSTNITQQLLQDKGGSSSVTQMSLELIDQDGEMSRLISPGIIVDDILGRKCKVYINFSGGNHPDDSALVHKGIVTEVKSMPVSVKFNISSPESQKRQKLFIKQSVDLAATCLIGDTTITVDTTNGFLTPYSPYVETYVRINDEIIKYTGLTTNTLTGCVRAQLGTVASQHEIDDSAESFYKLSGNGIDLALVLMMSNGDEYFATDIDIENIGAISNTELIPNIVFFNIYDVKEKYGLTIGDKFTISGSLSNDAIDLVISGFGKNDFGSWIETSSSFITELNSSGVVSFKSKWNLMPYGAGMTPDDVDVEKHEEIKNLFSSTIPDYTFYLKDTIELKDFISSELYFPAGLYTLPRVRASVGITLPPIADQNVPELTEDNVLNPSEIFPERSTNKNFYNAVVVKYNEDSVDDKLLNGLVTYSANSNNQIKNVGNKVFLVESKGLRPGGGTNTLVNINSRRWLERYEYASEAINGLKIFFKDAYKIEVGDIVVFGASGLKTVNIDTGVRDGTPKLYEVVNKSINVKTGESSLNLLSTAFKINGRYGIVSPSSYVGSGSTVDFIIIKDSFSTVSPVKEKEKWSNYTGETLTIHSQDFSYQENFVFLGFDPGNDYKMLITPSLSIVPSENYILEVSEYPNNNVALENVKLKTLHCFFNPKLYVTGGTSGTVFDVSDATNIFVGSIVRVHSFDYSVDSEETKVLSVAGNTITVNDDLGFTPIVDYEVDLIGFKDGGLPYRIL